ncbi:MAG: hypothetical protein WKG01_29080 [Kofleriaceae bacterium]
MRLVRGEEECDVQLEGLIVRVDQLTVVRLASIDEARETYHKLSVAKQAEGFVEAVDPIVDRDARLVHADELQLRGDPLGELITVQHELDQLPSTVEPRQRRRVENRAAGIIDANHETWFGVLARHVRKPSRKGPAIPAVDVVWQLGYAEEVHLRGTEELPIEHAYARLRSLPLSRQILRLVIGEPGHGLDRDVLSYENLIATMLEYGIPSRLRELVLGAGQPHRRPGMRLGDLRTVVAAAASLEVLRIVGGHGELGFTSSTLRTLELSDVVPADLRGLADARLPVLEELILHARSPIGPPELAQFPALAHVTLDQFVRGPHGMVALIDHLVALPSVRTIALRRCELDDRELAVLLEAPERYAHLNRIDLRHHRFSRGLAARAKRLLPNLRT